MQNAWQKKKQNQKILSYEIIKIQVIEKMKDLNTITRLLLITVCWCCEDNSYIINNKRLTTPNESYNIVHKAFAEGTMPIIPLFSFHNALH